MILYDNVCTPCVRKQEWRQLRRFARQQNAELTRIDVKKQPQHLNKIWWNTEQIPLPVVEYEISGDKMAVNLTEFLRLSNEENV